MPVPLTANSAAHVRDFYNTTFLVVLELLAFRYEEVRLWTVLGAIRGGSRLNFGAYFSGSPTCCGFLADTKDAMRKTLKAMKECMLARFVGKR